MKKALITLAVCVLGVSALGQSFTDIDNAQYYGKINIPKTHAVLDASFAKLEGGSTLDSTASVSDSWKISASHASATGLYATVTLLDSSAAQTDTDYVQVDLFEGVNDSAESTVWGSIHVVVDDNTTNTEDSAIEVYQPVAGVQTKVLDISAGVATFTETPVCSDGLTVATNATVGGTLGVTGVLTLTAAPVVTAVTTSGSATAVMTNAPAITEETPVWMTISYGGSDYVVPMWLKD